ncbi:unnamed protein product [Adineta steineri]|uniref:RRM domain-containing protein n=1 Tax=Adineta steineri TaxID=433720 RepID=A0A815A560_9BILA|nr:unnamed protein product [Adineta steineri]CAF1587344.1 unnamed protein product [Adineta steineri]
MSENDNLKQSNDELEPEQKRKVFIGSLSYRIDEGAFREYWTQYGTVLDATILRDREGHSRGFGFVTFENSSSVDALMQARPHTLDNRIVEPKRAVPREESHKADMQSTVKKIYLGGVKEPLTEDDLKDYFSKYGTITDTVITKDREGQYRGFAFIEFNDYDSVDRIVLEKNHTICGQQLDVQKAQSKDRSQRSGGNMRGRSRPPYMSKSNYDGGYNNYQQNSYNDSYDQMPNNNYDGYNSNFSGGYDNGSSFGQGYDQRNVGGPMRRGHMAGGRGHGYAPYDSRGRGGARGVSDDGGQGPSWASWN